MLPSFAGHNTPDHVLRDAELGSEGDGVGVATATTVTTPNFPNLLVGKLRIRVGCARLRRLDMGAGAALRVTVPEVVALRSQKQVSGVRTGWIVTLMQHAHPLGNRAVMQFPRQPVASDQPKLAVNQHLESGVSETMKLLAAPSPAASAWFSVSPEAIGKSRISLPLHGRYFTGLVP